ncbi:MAG: class I SAM-dependent methyltransferase [Acidimicrobiia bacterium]|nr:class I SAM-dependent methyltransferase [Acidimicrobiia bacterium]
MEALHRLASRLTETAGRLTGRSALQGRIATLEAQLGRLEGAGDGAGAAGGTALAGETRELYPTGHFYSAVPSRQHLERYRDLVLGQDPLRIAGVELHLDEQRALLDELAPLVADVPFSDHGEDGGRWRYHFHNDFFAYADGLFLHLLLRHLRPSHVVEVGSGFSSACLLDTSEAFLGGEVQFTFVEPYDDRLRSLLRPGDEARVEIRNEEVQRVPLDLFRRLGPGDLLLIDSTHTVKAAGDVNWLFFEVLPELAPGVLVHVHDIFPGFEYHWPWLEQGRAWAESYLLRAFLQYNSAFEIVLWPSLMVGVEAESIAARFPQAMANIGGSIYLRRRR